MKAKLTADAPTNACPLCAASFTCGMEAGLDECWCARLPRVMRVPDAPGGCYCPTCLKAAVEAAAAQPDASGGISEA